MLFRSATAGIPHPAHFIANAEACFPIHKKNLGGQCSSSSCPSHSVVSCLENPSRAAAVTAAGASAACVFSAAVRLCCCCCFTHLTTLPADQADVQYTGGGCA